jgi:DNA polymerase-3 subunit delta'
MIYPWQIEHWHQFRQQLAQQRLPHAIIVSGVAGLGQLALAEHMVAAILCENLTEQHCGQCHSCQLLAAGSHSEHTVIRPEEIGKQIKIEQIRELKQKQTLTSTLSVWKTVIIEPADAMNINAYNSLLKLLEEPSDNTLLILVSSQVDKLPITILSRCQKYILRAPSQQQAIEWLNGQGQYENSHLVQLLALSSQAPLSVLNMLETDTLGYLKQIDHDFSAMVKGNINPVISAKEWQKYDLVLVFNYLQILVKNSVIKHSESDDNRMWYIYDCIINTIKLLSSSHNLNKVLLIEQFMVSVINAKDNKACSLNSLF